jgi:hypothetical protein
MIGAVGDAILIKRIVQLAGVDPQTVLITDIDLALPFFEQARYVDRFLGVSIELAGATY